MKEYARQRGLRRLIVPVPVGIGGWLYWYGIYPIHELVFQGMLRGIARAAEAGDGE